LVLALIGGGLAWASRTLIMRKLKGLDDIIREFIDLSGVRTYTNIL
jgi:glutathionyl-hydroquinone reductase